MNRVVIKGRGDGRTIHVYVDGIELTRLTAFRITADIDNLPMIDVRLKMYLDEIDVDADVAVERRDTVKLADIEAIDRVIHMLGDAGMNSLTQRLIELLERLATERRR